MNKEKYKNKLKEIIKIGEYDPEEAHFRADKVLCEILKELGYGDIVELWEEVPKWYA